MGGVFLFNIHIKNNRDGEICAGFVWINTEPKSAPRERDADLYYAGRVRVGAGRGGARGDHSVRRASTGSFFAAMEEGMRPAIKVRKTLMHTKMIPAIKGSCAWAPVWVWA